MAIKNKRSKVSPARASRREGAAWTAPKVVRFRAADAEGTFSLNGTDGPFFS